MDVSDYSPMTFAFMGDCVYDLLVRRRVIMEANRPAKDLHSICSEMVCCKGQVKAFKKVVNYLTEEELNVFTRGRNAKVKHIPKHATPAEYHIATGFESIFGYLYLKGDMERKQWLFEIIFSEGVLTYDDECETEIEGT